MQHATSPVGVLRITPCAAGRMFSGCPETACTSGSARKAVLPAGPGKFQCLRAGRRWIPGLIEADILIASIKAGFCFTLSSSVSMFFIPVQLVRYPLGGCVLGFECIILSFRGGWRGINLLFGTAYMLCCWVTREIFF